MALHLVATSVRYAANGGVLGGLVGMHAAILPEHNGRNDGGYNVHSAVRSGRQAVYGGRYQVYAR